MNKKNSTFSEFDSKGRDDFINEKKRKLQRLQERIDKKNGKLTL